MQGQMSNFPNGFANGVAIRGLNLVGMHGKPVKWVSSSAARHADGSFNRPYSSLATAFNKAETDDIFLVKPGHAETVATAGAIDADVAGVTVIGLGTGSRRPTFTFNGVVGADIDIDAANITFQNLLFVAGVDALTGPIDVNEADFAMIGCETRDTTASYQTVDWIVAAASKDRLTIVDHVHRGATDAGADTWLTIVGGDGHYIRPLFVDGNFAVACVENVTTAATNLTFCGSAASPCFMRNRNAADVIFTAVATTTGNVGPHIYARLADDAANITEAFVGADMQFFQPIAIANADGEVGMETNITASTDA